MKLRRLSSGEAGFDAALAALKLKRATIQPLIDAFKDATEKSCG